MRGYVLIRPMAPLVQKRLFMAKTAYNKARRYDWKPLRQEVFGSETTVESKQEHKVVHTYIPPADEGEFLDRPPAKLPVSPSLGSEESADGGKKFSFAAPVVRVAKHLEDGSASGVGGRKTAVAKAWVAPLSAQKALESFSLRGAASSASSIVINGRDLVSYFAPYEMREAVLEPMLVTETLSTMRVAVDVHGGGLMAQARAVKLAIARALQNYDPDWRWSLKLAGCLERDSRIVERKKTGKPKARRSKQWSKR